MIGLKIDNASPVPVYQQLKQSIILDIMADRLREGDQLPSIRTLAKMLKLNPNTVAKVYYNLEEEGFIQGKRGSGYRVKGQKARLDKLKVAMMEDELKNFLSRAFSLGFSKKDIEALFRRVLDHEK
jgi:GntR family transcriptional regulator